MNAVIYCRVSSKEQVDGTSLESQEIACKEYATRNNLEVLKTFVERGESAKFADRPQLLEMIAFCSTRNNAVEQVLVWKVDRLARNVADHFSIKAGLLKQGISVVSVTEPIDTKPEGKLLETILAGFAQFDNDIRAARCTQGMRRKIQEGMFPWRPPIGYRSANRPGAKKTIPDAPDQPAFGLIQQGLEEFASGNVTKAQLQRLLTDRGLRTRPGKPISHQTIDYLLSNDFYAGIVRDPWSGEEFQGKHLAMISHETFRSIQRIIAGRSRAVPHLTKRHDFPLRTFVRCASCETTMTGSFSRGRSARYPYYRCFRRECDNQRSYPLAEVHGEFAAFLDEISADSHTLSHVRETVCGIGESWDALRRLNRGARENEVNWAKGQLQQLLRLKIESIITDEEFKQERARLSGRLAEIESRCGDTNPALESVLADLDAVSPQLPNLSKFWAALAIDNRQRFQLLALPSGFVIGRVGTARKGRLFSLIATSQPVDASLVHPDGTTWNQLVNEIRAFARISRERTSDL
jgi:DNA invertase Pin-like site-specific DNA recombinase